MKPAEVELCERAGGRYDPASHSAIWPDGRIVPLPMEWELSAEAHETAQEVVDNFGMLVAKLVTVTLGVAAVADFVRWLL